MRPYISLQVQELHRLYRIQQLLMADAANGATMAMPPAATRCNLEDDDERRAAENDAGSSRSWDDAYSQSQQQGNNKAPPPLVLQESELELTLALGCFGAAGTKKEVAAKKEASSSVDSRTSFSSSSTESGSPDCGVRRLPPPSLIGSVPGQPTRAGQRLEQEGLPQPPWLHKCLNLAR